MIYFCAIILFLTVCSGYNTETLSNFDSQRYFFFVGNDDRDLTLIDSMEPVDEEFVQKHTRANNNGYWLFTRGNTLTPQILQYENDSSVINSNFNKNKNTVFLSHGWRGSGNSEINKMLTEAFLQAQDVNVIVLDWSDLAGQNYMTAIKGVPLVGRNLGQFISWLVTLGASYEDTHLVGFSLGGHLVGNAGRETGGKVKRITALDPAGPLWLLNPDSLNKTDGQYVEVIHTSLLIGHFIPYGTTDFYPNGGMLQPGCVIVSCSHSRSYELMAATVKFNHLKGNKCNDMAAMALDDCTGQTEHMGNSDLMQKSPGIYRVNTKGNYPYEAEDK